MDALMIFYLIFILLGLVTGFFSVRIYQLTKGASKGWFYMALAGVFLSIWACTQSITLIFFKEVNLITIILSLISFSVISFSIPLGIIKLNKSFDISLPKIFSDKSIIIVYIGLWLVLLAFNLFIMPFINFFMELAGIAHIMIVIMFIITIYPAYLLWKSTKVWIWLLIFLFLVISSFSLAIGSYKVGCCADHPLESAEEVCRGIVVDFSEAIPIPCTASAVKLVSYDLILLTISIILGVVAFYGLWRNLNAINNPKQ